MPVIDYWIDGVILPVRGVNTVTVVLVSLCFGLGLQSANNNVILWCNIFDIIKSYIGLVINQ